MQNTITGAYVKLWDIKDPFLIDEFMDRELDADELPETDMLFLALIQLGYITANELRKHRTIQLFDSCIPQMFLVTWIWSSELLTRNNAIRYMDMISQDDTDDGQASWLKFLSMSVEGCCGNSEILEAVQRDFADEHIIDDNLARAFIVLTMWQHYYSSLGETLTGKFDLGPSCLAAARRQLCRGIDSRGDDDSLLAVISGTFESLFAGPPLRGRHCYAYLDLLCQIVMLRLELDGSDLLVILKRSLEYGLIMLRRQLSSARAQSSAFRADTLRAWDTVANELARRRVAQRSTHWRRFAQTWGAARLLLAPTHSGETPAIAFGALERCAWAGCLCSRHRPAHRMRVCKGCERVAYCGKRCQQKDWQEGGHREFCQTRDAP
ncbi:zinc finger MYND domain-containing protein [Phanerochaete sordida]|uniref:Zinc finger MYND domain-containing protein n=1 Tax=Phanerochaete sordida TaxID=48140 RepID=A0A9P3LG70_9APHY|nr:zinc finger MYND domain-containing protein [Phanerochaete sordida]